MDQAVIAAEKVRPEATVRGGTAYALFLLTFTYTSLHGAERIVENRGLAPASNWQVLDADRGFQDLIGPIFRVSDLTPSSSEPIRLGFRVAAKHCNAAGVSHGGMLSAFLDCALGTAVFESTENRVFAPTLNLSIDFIQSAYVDQWLESRVRLTHMTSGVGYCDGIIQGPQGTIARAHAVFRLPKKAHTPF